MKYPRNVFFKYPKDKFGKPLGLAVAIIVEDGKPFTGVAVTSKGDKFDRSIGRSIALNRAEEERRRYRASKVGTRDSNEKQSLDVFGC